MNKLLSKLNREEVVIGTVCTLGSVESVEIACYAGFDFVVVDWEHGAFNSDRVRESLRAIQATGVAPVVRPPVASECYIEQLLDMGYLSMLVPMVNTPQRARDIATAACYPPLGMRSLSGTRAAMCYGNQYRNDFNAALLMMVRTVLF